MCTFTWPQRILDVSDGHITGQVTDLLTFEEWSKIVTSSTFDTTTQNMMQSYLQNLASINDPEMKIKIANEAIRFLHNSSANRVRDENL